MLVRSLACSFARGLPTRPDRFVASLEVAVFAAILAMLGAKPFFAWEYKIGEIELEQPWSRATPAGARVAGGYVEITNEGAAPDRLVSASAEIAGKTEIHRMAINDGVMRMRSLGEGLPVPAKSKVILRPAFDHLMFLDLKRPLKQGEAFTGTLVFEKAGSVTVTYAVQSIGARSADIDHATAGR